jgi:hypothetical protein
MSYVPFSVRNWLIASLAEVKTGEKMRVLTAAKVHRPVGVRPRRAAIGRFSPYTQAIHFVFYHEYA